MHADIMEINECRHIGLELISTYQTTTLSAPRGVTMSAGAKEYATKFNISPKITVGRRGEREREKENIFSYYSSDDNPILELR